MGCAQSKIDNEESVAICKERRNFMKEAVSARNAFASGHSGYSVSLKNTGAALSDYAHGEAENNEEPIHLQSRHQAAEDTPEPPLPPPSPPLPTFSPAPPLQRSVTMPEFSVSKETRKMKNVAIAEDEEESDVDSNLKTSRNRRGGDPKSGAETPLPPPSPEETPEPPPSPGETPEPPPPTELKGMVWDYFLMLENMPGPSLSETDEVIENNEEPIHLQSRHQAAEATPEPPLPPSSPPLPTFSPAPPLQRSVTMPEFSVSKETRKMKNVAIAEDEEESDVDSNLKTSRNRRGGDPKSGAETPLPPPSPGETPEPPPSPGETPEPPPPTELKGMGRDYFFMVENMPGPSLSETDEVIEEKDENEEEEEQVFEERYNRIHSVGAKIEEIEPKTPEKVMPLEFDAEEEVTPVGPDKNYQFLHSNAAPHDIRRGSNPKKAGCSVNLLKILGDIDDHFLKASEVSQQVSKMLEATRLHYHSNFADNRGHIDYAARVMQVITWNKSFRGVPKGDSEKGGLDAEDYETHATVLDKLLAWEKKLYEEVKAGELVKLEYQRKVSLLNKLKKRNASTESLDKTKAAVSHLQARYIVNMQQMDWAVSEVNHIRDDQLYPKLVALVNGMANMWEAMVMHHHNQLQIAMELKALEATGAPEETTKHHHELTIQLWNVITEWHSQFDKLVTNQKQYIHALTNWLNLTLVPIESNLREKISSPPRVENPPIQPLLHYWRDLLEKLPDELAKSAIASFAAVIKAIINHQEEEMKLKEKCEETRKELLRKNQAFDDWYQKYMQRRTPTHEAADQNRGEGTNPKDPVSEKQLVVEILKRRLENEVEEYRKRCVQVRDKSLGSLKVRLPELFHTMLDYSRACHEGYGRLRALTQNHNVNGHN